MLRTIKFRMLFALLLAGFFIISVDTLLTQPVDNTNINVVTLHFRAISENRPSRGSLNYDLYVIENNQHYKIGADVADCFSYDAFHNDVKPGQLIKIGVRKDNGFFRASDMKFVVLLMIDDQTYLRSQCVNKTLSNDKTNTPLIGVFSLAFIYFMLKYQEEKDSEKSKKKKQPIDEID